MLIHLGTGSKSKSHMVTNSNELRLIAWNNMAATYIKLKEYRKVIEKASHVIREDKTNKKALFRRGLAHRKLGNLDAAYTDLKAAALKHKFYKMLIQQYKENYIY